VSDVNGDETGNYDLNLELLNGSPLTDENGGVNPLTTPTTEKGKNKKPKKQGNPKTR